MATPAWREFETLAYDIQRELAADAVVTLHDTIRGAESGIHRQIDISIRKQVGQYSILVVVDCKAHRDDIDVNTVEQFVTTLRDVRANKGALIASSGFTQAALEMAKAYGIDTFRLVDTAHANWRAYVSIPALLVRSRMKDISFAFSGAATAATEFPAGDPSLWELYGPDGAALGTVRDLCARKWNAHELPEDPGRHEVELSRATMQGTTGTLSVVVSVSFGVVREYYFGPLPLHTRGFQNAQTGGLIMRTFATETIEPYEIEQGRVPGWRQIDDPNALAVRPTLVLGYTDTLPDMRRRPNGG